jgi:hypothetical protein
VPVLAVYDPSFVKLPANPTVAAPFSVNVPFIVISELNVRVAAAVSEILPLASIANAPVNVLVPVAVMFSAPSTVLVPEMVQL